MKKYNSKSKWNKKIDRIIERQYVLIHEVKNVENEHKDSAKQIIGEADVLDQITMEKNQLWELTADESGVTHEFF